MIATLDFCHYGVLFCLIHMVSPSSFLTHIHFHSLQFALLWNHQLILISFCNKHILILPISDIKSSDAFRPQENKRPILFPSWDCSWKDVLKYLCKLLIASTLGGLLWGLSWISGYEVCKTLSVCGCCLHFFISLSSLFLSFPRALSIRDIQKTGEVCRQ